MGEDRTKDQLALAAELRQMADYAEKHQSPHVSQTSVDIMRAAASRLTAGAVRFTAGGESPHPATKPMCIIWRRLSPGTVERSVRATNAYWNSIEAGRQRR